MTELLFVYGTLKRSWLADRNLWPPAATAMLEDIAGRLLALTWRGEASTPGRLYRVSHYPALVTEEPAGTVYGELYELPHDSMAAAELLQRLDAYEECAASDPLPHEYRRVVIRVMADSEERMAYAYVYNRAVTGLVPISDGVFRPS